MKFNDSTLRNSTSVFKLSRFATQIDRLHQHCLNFWDTLIRSSVANREPKVDWKRDRQGNTYLEIFDPTTEMHWYFQSEQEARVWFDQRYYIR
jgi:hypothetical protein